MPGMQRNPERRSPRINWLLRLTFLVLAASLWLGAMASAQISEECCNVTGAWGLRTAGVPMIRSLHSMAYDISHGTVVLFGGVCSTFECDFLWGETWTWNGVSWSQAFPGSAPSARGAAGMVYDAARNRTVLFGGTDGTSAFGDTWEWDGITWREVTPPAGQPSPSPRAAATMAYDPGRQRVVLCGGGYSSGGPALTSLADTWEWNGVAWTNVTPTLGPPARYGHAMTYDGDRVILFGGFGAYPDMLGDTWAWDGSAWHDVTPPSGSSPASRSFPQAVYANSCDKVILYGGQASSGATLDDTWEWSRASHAWSRIAISGPPART